MTYFEDRQVANITPNAPLSTVSQNAQALISVRGTLSANFKYGVDQAFAQGSKIGASRITITDDAGYEQQESWHSEKKSIGLKLLDIINAGANKSSAGGDAKVKFWNKCIMDIVRENGEKERKVLADQVNGVDMAAQAQQAEAFVQVGQGQQQVPQYQPAQQQQQQQNQQQQQGGEEAALVALAQLLMGSNNPTAALATHLIRNLIGNGS